MKKFIAELRRRQVFRATGLYIGVAWIVLEGADILLPAFEAPDWVFRTLVIVAFAGAPVTAVLAWIYEITERGIKREEEVEAEHLPRMHGRQMDFIVIGMLTVALIFSVYMNVTSGPDVVERKEPVSVLIADLVNETGDEMFDGTLEQALQIGIESAPFVTGYRRDAALKLASSLSPVTALDESAARLVAVREGIKLVMAGSIIEDNGRYTLYVRALDPKGGEVLTSAEVDAKDKLDVLAAVGELSGDLREELEARRLDLGAEGLLGRPHVAQDPFARALVAVEVDHRQRAAGPERGEHRGEHGLVVVEVVVGVDQDHPVDGSGRQGRRGQRAVHHRPGGGLTQAIGCRNTVVSLENSDPDNNKAEHGALDNAIAEVMIQVHVSHGL